jgi:glyoxylase-like metal-dependent hydrolase (beta-lactamase superfamily II)
MEQNTGAAAHHVWFEVAHDVWGVKDVFVNVFFIRNADDNTWVLVDTGLKSSYSRIKKVAGELFGNKPPSAIILTHGHFDHAGSANKLASEWRVPVYAHYLELPYLMGKSAYPPPDPTVGGGMLAWFANIYPSKAITIETVASVLPDDGVVPFLNEWKWIHTPGHAPGHVSLYRKEDKLLIAGDALATTSQESAMAVMLQKKKISRPPAYFTYDWDTAYESVEKLAVLRPEIVASGHGKPMYGEAMRNELYNLCDNFYEEAVPRRGRYIADPAVADASGVIYVPAKPARQVNWWAVGAAVVLTAGVFALLSDKNKRKKWYQFR